MRIFTLLLVFALAAWATAAPAQAATRMVQCEDCSVPQMRSRALSQGQGVGLSGTYYVFSLKKQLVLGFWVAYDPGTRRWSASSVEVPSPMVDMFAHMLNAYEIKRNVFVGQQVFRGRIDDIGGGSHDPVGISLRGHRDDGYVRFMNNLAICMGTRACAAKIDPALAQLNLGQKLALSLNLSLFKGLSGGISWENTPPEVVVHLCNINNDCAVVKYEDDKWVYVESRAEGGNGKVYPKPPEQAHYEFANSGEAGIFERGLRGGGASIFGNWNLRTVLACTSAGSNYQCQYYVIPY